MTPFLEARGLGKSYGRLRANEDVSFSIFPGEVVGIVGENGAGKSTLVKMLGGALAPDAGEILISGQPSAIRSPADAQRAGISLVHQHFNLVENLTVEENLVLGRPELRRGVLHFRRLRPGFERIADELGVRIAFESRVSTLSVGSQQQVELIRALFHDPRLLILDEPTAVLPPSERDLLLAFIRKLKGRGVATILISHKLDDLYDCCDRALVMRGGRVVGTSELQPQDRSELVRLIVGAELPAPDMRPGSPGACAVSVKDIVVRRQNGTIAVDRASFELRGGEIVGLCGVEGNGQTELLHALAGMQPVQSGEIVYSVDGKSVVNASASALRQLGVAHVPEDRLRYAVVPPFSLAANWLLRKLSSRRFVRWGLLRLAQVANAAAEAVTVNDVRAAGAQARISELSGGNQQKFVIARELDGEVAVILAGHPTRGLDIRTVLAIRNRLVAERANGVAILLLSADLSEVWDIADRIIVMARGRLRGPVSVRETTLAEIGHWMTAP